MNILNDTGLSIGSFLNQQPTSQPKVNQKRDNQKPLTVDTSPRQTLIGYATQRLDEIRSHDGVRSVVNLLSLNGITTPEVSNLLKYHAHRSQLKPSDRNDTELSSYICKAIDSLSCLLQRSPIDTQSPQCDMRRASDSSLFLLFEE